MTVSCIITGALDGIDGKQVMVEVDSAAGIPRIDIVGLPDATVNEAKERVRSALKNAGFECPLKKLTINLAPADVKKVGTGFDLPMAVGILQSAEYFPSGGLLEEACLIGELSLDGSIRAVRGILSIALMARDANINAIVVPEANMAEASLVEGITVYGLSHLSQLPRFLDQPQQFLSPFSAQELMAEAYTAYQSYTVDFKDVKGQGRAKRALEVAAAGGHNIALFGPPGSGKSMLAKAFVGILPPMDFEEILEVSRIYSVAGLLNSDQVVMHHRPFRSPHHSASSAGITGGGSHPKPGEITLAHRGVLFMDEFPEFPRAVLEVLRQPLEDGVITVSRAKQTLTFPANFILLTAMNPCPCGYKGDSLKSCSCHPAQIQRYMARISGPLMDRIDLNLEVSRISEAELLGRSQLSLVHPEPDTTETIRARVLAARNLQRQRYADLGIRTNSEMRTPHLRQFCQLSETMEAMMLQACRRFHLSGRSFDRILKLTRTIADLAGSEQIQSQHLAEALQYREFITTPAETRPAAQKLQMAR